MTRSEILLDGLLRHLGAAYYDSLQGRASPDDVARAVESVAEHLNEVTVPAKQGTQADARPAAAPARES
jgi:hypothetical protein